MPQEYGINYHAESGYMVFKLKDGEIVFRSDSKGACISVAQELNGWQVTGNEQDYANQRQHVPSGRG